MEKKLNFIVGLFVLSNLYFLNSLIGISRNSLIVSLMLISLVFFLKNFSFKLVSFLNFKLGLSFILLSAVFLILNIFFKDYQINPNDMFRVFWYMLFFGWTNALYKEDKKGFQQYIKRLCEVLLLVIVVISFFEYYFYLLFRALVAEDSDDLVQNIRLAGTFMDPNSFAGALSVFLFIYLKENGFTIKGWIYFLVSFLLINLSGSRLGLLLLLVIVLPYVFNFKLIYLIKKSFLVVFFIGMLSMLYLNVVKKEDNKEYNAVSTVDRIFNPEFQDKSEASNNERLGSIDDGIRASSISNLILPPGNFYFQSKWKQEIKGEHYPHSGFIYMLDEYGIYVFLPLLIVFMTYKKFLRSKNMPLFFLMIAQFLLLPNFMYYPIIFFIIFYIEMNYEYSRDCAIIKK
jgi:hypothetical protein